jgi:hypothetical protein
MNNFPGIVVLYDGISYLSKLIHEAMKVTALLPDDIIQEVKKLSGGKNITESILIALQDYIARQKIRKSIQKVKEKPLQFKDGFTAEKVRSLNRDL